MQRMDAEQAARDAAVEERKAKLEEAFRRGGGDALSASLAERALADEKRAAEQQAAYAAEQQAREHDRQKQRDDRTREQLSVLKLQVCRHTDVHSHAHLTLLCVSLHLMLKRLLHCCIHCGLCFLLLQGAASLVVQLGHASEQLKAIR